MDGLSALGLGEILRPLTDATYAAAESIGDQWDRLASIARPHLTQVSETILQYTPEVVTRFVPDRVLPESFYHYEGMRYLANDVIPQLKGMEDPEGFMQLDSFKKAVAAILRKPGGLERRMQTYLQAGKSVFDSLWAVGADLRDEEYGMGDLLHDYENVDHITLANLEQMLAIAMTQYGPIRDALAQEQMAHKVALALSNPTTVFGAGFGLTAVSSGVAFYYGGLSSGLIAFGVGSTIATTAGFGTLILVAVPFLDDAYRSALSVGFQQLTRGVVEEVQVLQAVSRGVDAIVEVTKKQALHAFEACPLLSFQNATTEFDRVMIEGMQYHFPDAQEALIGALPPWRRPVHVPIFDSSYYAASRTNGTNATQAVHATTASSAKTQDFIQTVRQFQNYTAETISQSWIYRLGALFTDKVLLNNMVQSSASMEAARVIVGSSVNFRAQLRHLIRPVDLKEIWTTYVEVMKTPLMTKYEQIETFQFAWGKSKDREQGQTPAEFQETCRAASGVWESIKSTLASLSNTVGMALVSEGEFMQKTFQRTWEHIQKMDARTGCLVGFLFSIAKYLPASLRKHVVGLSSRVYFTPFVVVLVVALGALARIRLCRKALEKIYFLLQEDAQTGSEETAQENAQVAEILLKAQETADPEQLQSMRRMLEAIVKKQTRANLKKVVDWKNVLDLLEFKRLLQLDEHSDEELQRLNSTYIALFVDAQDKPLSFLDETQFKELVLDSGLRENESMFMHVVNAAEALQREHAALVNMKEKIREELHDITLISRGVQLEKELRQKSLARALLLPPTPLAPPMVLETMELSPSGQVVSKKREFIGKEFDESHGSRRSLNEFANIKVLAGEQIQEMHQDVTNLYKNMHDMKHTIQLEPVQEEDGASAAAAAAASSASRLGAHGSWRRPGTHPPAWTQTRRERGRI